MVYPKQTDNYDIDIFNQNFRELDTRHLGTQKALTGIEESVSDVFSETKTYATGDYCIYLNKLYKFTADKPAGSWDGTKVVPCTVMGEIGSLNGAILKYGITSEIDNVTINASGNYEIASELPHNILFATIASWASNTGSFSVIGNGKNIHVVGDPGTVIRKLRARYWYM